jgi:NAD(P)-dependent dehydrogenase (short-subunit alcohol dehydrogenase family)
MGQSRIVLVTGASQGIGAATARAFAEAGDRVVLTARRGDKLDEVIAGLGRAGANATAIASDVAARRAVIISEPVDNLSHHDSFLGRLAPHLTNPGVGEYDHRYSLAELQALMSAHGASAFLHRPGDRNAIAVFRRDPA